MLVFVATPEQIDQAFLLWIDETHEDDRRIVHQVYLWFMSSDSAKAYNTVSGLVSFNLDDWLLKFSQWIDSEIFKQPIYADNIKKWSTMLIDHISSDWGIKQKLIVRECLEDNDLNNHLTVSNNAVQY